MAATWRCSTCGHLVKHAAARCTNCRAERAVDGGDIAPQDPADPGFEKPGSPPKRVAKRARRR